MAKLTTQYMSVKNCGSHSPKWIGNALSVMNGILIRKKSWNK